MFGQHAVRMQRAKIGSWRQFGISNELQRPNLAQVLLGLTEINHVRNYRLSISNGQLGFVDKNKELRFEAKQPVQFIALFTSTRVTSRGMD